MRSTLNLNSIKRSLSGLSDSVKGAIKRSEQISDNIKDRNLAKKESISMSAEFFAKRRDNQRRRENNKRIFGSNIRFRWNNNSWMGNFKSSKNY